MGDNDEREFLSSGYDGQSRRIPSVVAAVAVLAVLGALAYTSLRAVHEITELGHVTAALHAAQDRVVRQDTELDHLAAALHAAPSPAQIELPEYGDSGMVTFGDPQRAHFYMVTATIKPDHAAAPLAWMFLFGEHLTPGVRYGLLGGSCGDGQMVSYDWADGVADAHGHLTITAPNLSLNPHNRMVWVLVHKLSSGTSLGGVRGPFVGTGWRPFDSAPRC